VPRPALAVTLPQFRPEAAQSVPALEDSYRLGYGGGFVFDHLWPLGQPERPALDGWTLLAGLAASLAGVKRRAEPGAGPAEPRTGPAEREGGPARAGAAQGEGARYRLGTLVTRAGLRPPALVAHMARSVGSAAGAPPIVGVGMGDAGNRPENEAFGFPYHTDPEKRAAELSRTIEALRGPLAGSPAPDVWVGGTSRRARVLAGRLGDGWNAWGLYPDEFATGLAEVRRAALDAGREPASVAGTWGGQVLVAGDRGQADAMLERWGADRAPAEVARVVAGDPETVAGTLDALGEAGATWCVLAFVGGPADRMRALVATAYELLTRPGGR
jgi:alkanesulfonate monooxygenase SsuD/methylene tetrahydromethanopterin reductase-like flavin-dependent oxidoreductase (luciferase family)